MEAPEKIYTPTILAANTFSVKEDGSMEYVRVEYVLADAFMEKAVEYLYEHFDYDCTSESDCGYVISDNYSSWEDFIEDFKNYMKGVSA